MPLKPINQSIIQNEHFFFINKILIMSFAKKGTQFLLITPLSLSLSNLTSLNFSSLPQEDIQRERGAGKGREKEYALSECGWPSGIHQRNYP